MNSNIADTGSNYSSTSSNYQSLPSDFGSVNFNDIPSSDPLASYKRPKSPGKLKKSGTIYSTRANSEAASTSITNRTAAIGLTILSLLSAAAAVFNNPITRAVQAVVGGKIVLCGAAILLGLVALAYFLKDK